MVKLAFRRVIWGFAMAIAVSAIVFVIFYVLPSGDPAVMRAGPGATPEQVEVVRHSLALDRPPHAQYAQFLWNLTVHHDLGYSYHHLMPVSSLIWSRLPVTLALVVGGVAIALVAGIGLGVRSAGRPGSNLDRAVSFGSLVLISAPVFWLGFVAAMLFSRGTISFLPDLPGPGAWIGAETLAQSLGALILPWLVLGFSSAAIYFRFTREIVIDELNQPYVTAARARGISENRIRRYALRTGMAPLLALAGLDLGLVLAGNVILVETVFNLPGVGRLLVESVERADLPLTQGIVLVGLVAVVVVTIAVDVTHAAIDPRARSQEGPI